MNLKDKIRLKVCARPYKGPTNGRLSSCYVGNADYRTCRDPYVKNNEMRTTGQYYRSKKVLNVNHWKIYDFINLK